MPLGPIKPALALSLHTTKPELRAQLLPRAPRIDPAELVELADGYSRATGYPIQYQWTLLEGVNDGDDEIDRVADLLEGKYAVLNLIPVQLRRGRGTHSTGIEMPRVGETGVAAFGFRRPTAERAAALVRRLHARGVLAKVRRSAGQDVEAGCGQLRARAVTASV